MSNTLTIKVEFELPDDFEEQKARLIDIVESAVEELKAEELNNGDIDVTWDVDTDPKTVEG